MRFPSHTASCNTAKSVKSRWSASKPSSNITMEALNGINLALPSVLGALLLENLVSNSHYSLFLVCGFQCTLRAPTRPNRFIADGVPRNPHPTSPWRPWIAFISVFHLFWVRYYSKTWSPIAIIAFFSYAVSNAHCELQNGQMLS